MERQRRTVDKGRLTDNRIIEHRKNKVNYFRKIPRKVVIGVKDESYFTESEMIIGYVAPSYKELSIEEKIIFDKL